MNVFTVSTEWKLKGKGEKWNPSTVNVVAADVDVAMKAAIKHERGCFVEKLEGVRVTQVLRGASIDVIVN